MDIIQRGRVYRAKTPRQCGQTMHDQKGFVNDRVVLAVNLKGGDVMYDGPAVANGRHYPKCTLAAFKEWAGSDVTDIMPPGEWQHWPVPPTAIDAGTLAGPDAYATATGTVTGRFTSSESHVEELSKS